MDVEMGVQFPVFLTARFGRSGSIRAFSSLTAMESYLEPIDVADDEYLGWDSEGVALRFRVDGSGSDRHWLRLISTGVRDRDGLCEAIAGHARKLGVIVVTDPDCPPADLLARVRAAQEERRRLRRPWWRLWR